MDFYREFAKQIVPFFIEIIQLRFSLSLVRFAAVGTFVECVLCVRQSASYLSSIFSVFFTITFSCFYSEKMEIWIVLKIFQGCP